MDKKTKTRIKELKVEKRYDEIFSEFGQKIYNKVTPSKYKKQDIKKLKDEGRYEDIFRRYGENEYNKILSNVMYREIKEEKGTLKAVLWNLKGKIKRASLMSLLALSAATATISSGTKLEIDDNAKKYEKDIEAYNDKINDYAKEVRKLNLSDIQIYMKVMNDMWKNIKGYGTPKKDIVGFLELDLATEDGYGVCRNMANDVAKKINAINSKYNARTMIVTMEENGEYTIANIERNIIEDDITVEDNEKDDEDEQNHNEKMIRLGDIVGNHAVTLVDSPSDNLILVLDPTNPGIGIYQNGKISMFNTDKEKGIKYIPKEFVQSILVEGGLEGVTNVTSSYIESFKTPSLSLEEIEMKYGLEAQNKALNEIERIESQNDKQKFKNSLKTKTIKDDIEKNEKSIAEENIETIEIDDIEK